MSPCGRIMRGNPPAPAPGPSRPTNRPPSRAESRGRRPSAASSTHERRRRRERCTGQTSAPSAGSASCARVGGRGRAGVFARRAGDVFGSERSSRPSCSARRSSASASPSGVGGRGRRGPLCSSSSAEARASRPYHQTRRERRRAERAGREWPARRLPPKSRATARTGRAARGRPKRRRSSRCAARGRRRGRRARGACAGLVAAGSTGASRRCCPRRSSSCPDDDGGRLATGARRRRDKQGREEVGTGGRVGSFNPPLTQAVFSFLPPSSPCPRASAAKSSSRKGQVPFKLFLTSEWNGIRVCAPSGFWPRRREPLSLSPRRPHAIRLSNTSQRNSSCSTCRPRTAHGKEELHGRDR
jgi:hypothetical protein